ncbi:MAG: Holliday junction resolvase, partial [Spirochaetaceae bacterium]|nr:Holliday junction resolvase [Spirochaetaceae bacterium]
QIAEQAAPFLHGFPCKAEVCRFLGKPIDYIVFSGLYNNDTVDEIVFVEIKSGSSALSKREKSLKDAIEQKRVRYVEYRI